MTPAELLAAGREYLEDHGWIRGTIGTEEGEEVCSFGALIYALNAPVENWQASSEDRETILAACEAIVQVTGFHDPKVLINESVAPVFHVTSWNDREAKDKQEVLDVLAKAEKIVRAGFDPDAA